MRIITVRSWSIGGIIKYTTGKPEFSPAEGICDDVDIGFIFHAGAASETTLGLVKGYNGSTSKTVIFKGVSAHAAFTDMMPGVNALYAASQAMSACNALRENFANGVKWHPILTEGGGAVNAIPDKVVMESMVRGSSLADISKANDAMNRAIAALGCLNWSYCTCKRSTGIMPHNYGM